MAYRKSAARLDFEAELATIQTVLLGSPKLAKPISDYVWSCAIMFCSARIESYVQDVFDTIGDALSNAGPVEETLPEKFRAYLFGLEDQLVNTYAQFVAFRDERRLMDGLSKFFRNRYCVLADGKAMVPELVGGKIYKDRKYPSPDNVKALFARLDIAIFDELGKRAKRNVELDLQSFNSLRSSLAHSAVGPSLTLADIRNQIQRMQDMIGFMDRVLYSFVCKRVGDVQWRAVVCKVTVPVAVAAPAPAAP